MQVLNDTFASDWNELATQHSENDTEELELALWKEMSCTLQEVYRIFRKTNNEMKVSRKVSRITRVTIKIVGEISIKSGLMMGDDETNDDAKKSRKLVLKVAIAAN